MSRFSDSGGRRLLRRCWLLPARLGLARLGLALMLLLLAGQAQAVLPIEQWRTSGGVKVLFVKADGIPMLDVRVRFDAGDRLDPPGQSGLAGLTAALLDAGAGDLDEEGIADAFALLGAQRSAGSGDDSASVGLRTLTSEPELTEAVALLTQMISRPRFDEAVIEREKRRMVLALGNALKRPHVLLGRAFAQEIYPEHPYGVLTTAASIEAISAADLRAFHRRHYVPERASIAMIGAIDRARAEAVAEQLMAALPAGQAGNEVPPVTLPKATEVRIAHPATQSHIAIGAPLIARGDPDYFPLLVANYVLGGGSFVSRLYKQVRDDRGLAYSVSSGFSLRAQPGPFSISLQTRREKTLEALELVRQVLAEFVAAGPTEQEVQAARDNLAGGFALRMDSNGKILGLLSAIGYHDLPLDYLETWADRVRAVTLAQVRDAVRRRLDPAAMVTVIVGEAGSTS